MKDSTFLDSKQVIEIYKLYLNGQSHAPNWVYEFTDQVKLKKDNFYRHFIDLNHLEKVWWNGMFDQTIQAILEDQAYSSYNAPEKLLSFYFTLVEVLNQQEHACQLMLGRMHLPALLPKFLTDFKTKYLQYAQQVIDEGIQEQIIVDRVPITKIYRDGLWFQCFFVLQFWRQDQSEDRIRTDAAIEKAVSLSFDLMKPNALDSMMGFGKFLYQSWRAR